ncbi:MAG: FAD/NAD(P)-binding protein [Patescibacteria group bacterium]|nr:FAD/NAD(P)-binding protein [Patescibacteria group bacterium]
MINDYQTYNSKILKIENEGSESKTFTLSLSYPDFSFEPGQYVMVSLPGFGESPISLTSYFNEKKFIQLTIRKVGILTSAIHELKKGDMIGIRGPYGNSFPIGIAKGKNVLIVAGGIAIEPVRPIILDAVNNPGKYKKVFIFYGCRDESALIYKKEYPAWQKVCDLSLALDNPTTKKFTKGVVTALFDVKDIPADSIAYVCGPPVMYKFVLAKMMEKGFNPENIYVSLERHMDCGQGICQHCAIGTKYVCKDGPIFSYAELMNFKTWLSAI